MSTSKTETKPAPEKEKPQTTEVKKKNLTLLQKIRNDLLIIEMAITNNDVFHVTRVTKNVRGYKKKITAYALKLLWDVFFPKQQINFKNYSDYKENSETLELNKTQIARLQKLPEVEVYLETLLLIYLVRVKDLEGARTHADKCISKLNEINRRHLDLLGSVVYFYYSRTYELLGQLKDIRKTLFELYRHACIKRDELGQATLLNLLLRNFLHYKNYESAQQLISKTNFPENRYNNELIRFLYYSGKIKAIQGEYADAFARLTQAIRRAPEQTGLGFRVQAQKLAIIVELLLGEIPSRTIFSQPEISKFLKPYYYIVQAVHCGDMGQFKAIQEKFKSAFEKDDVLSLIGRLNKIVIKTGLRRINLSYSKISLNDIADRLQVSKEDVEFIVAKAIRDGVMNATINHEQRCVLIKGTEDLYSTQEPEEAFRRRTEYCLNLYTSSTKALQYPDTNAVKYEVEKHEFDPEELIKMVEEGDDDFSE